MNRFGSGDCAQLYQLWNKFSGWGRSQSCHGRDRGRNQSSSSWGSLSSHRRGSSKCKPPLLTTYLLVLRVSLLLTVASIIQKISFHCEKLYHIYLIVTFLHFHYLSWFTMMCAVLFTMQKQRSQEKVIPTIHEEMARQWRADGIIGALILWGIYHVCNHRKTWNIQMAEMINIPAWSPYLPML